MCLISWLGLLSFLLFSPSLLLLYIGLFSLYIWRISSLSFLHAFSLISSLLVTYLDVYCIASLTHSTKPLFLLPPFRSGMQANMYRFCFSLVLALIIYSPVYYISRDRKSVV